MSTINEKDENNPSSSFKNNKTAKSRSFTTTSIRTVKSHANFQVSQVDESNTFGNFPELRKSENNLATWDPLLRRKSSLTCNALKTINCLNKII